MLFPRTADLNGVLLYDISQADAEEVNSSIGKQCRFDISSAHGYAALSYPLLPYAFVQDYSENKSGCPDLRDGGLHRMDMDASLGVFLNDV
jgi:hypothetical protein